MKTSLLHAAIVCGALSVATAAHAQGPMFGIKGGLNYTNLAGMDSEDDNARIGFNGGIFGRTDPEAPIGAQVELLYSAKGNHTEYNAFFGLIDQDVDFNLNYLELPVLASFRFADIVDVQIGGYAAYLLSAKVSTTGDLGDGDDSVDKDNFKSIDAGIAGGVAFNLGANAQVGIRYLHGLSDVVDNEDLHNVIGDAKNRCLQVYVGIGMGGE